MNTKINITDENSLVFYIQSDLHVNGIMSTLFTKQSANKNNTLLESRVEILEPEVSFHNVLVIETPAQMEASGPVIFTEQLLLNLVGIMPRTIFCAVVD